jgi:hypothetical protein
MSTDPSSVDTGAEVDGTEADKINTGALGTLVAVGLFAMLSITAAVTALVRHDLQVEEAAKDADANQVVVALKASQSAALNGPAGYVDRGKGLVSLPIDLAEGLVVAELGRDPNSATPPAKVDASAAPATGAGGAGGAAAATGAGGTGGAAPATGAAVDGSTSSATLTTDPKTGGVKAPPGKPETGREVQKPAPGSSSRPSPVPTPTPTAATPGAHSPGPTNK